jgi:hypothetical protein
MDNDQSKRKLVKTHKEVKHSLNSQPKGPQHVENRRALYELRIYSFQRIFYIIVAPCVLLVTGDIVKFLFVLAAGFITEQLAKKIIANAIKNETTED